jgi:diguanylate cyclase (GGDEF)-like protein/PAS domain S-box-containing protein
MSWDNSLYSVPLWIASFAGALLARYAWHFRKFVGAKPFAGLMVAVAIWCLGYGFEIAAPGFSSKLWWAKIQYLGIVSVPLFWLVYTIDFTGNSWWLSSRIQRLLLIFPSITLLLAWTNEWHGLIWKQVQLNTQGPATDLTIVYGSWFWLNIAYSYALILVGTVLLIRFVLRSRGLFHMQARTLLIAALIPWLGNAIYVFRLNPVPDLDLTPFAFTITGLVIAWGVLRLQFLDIVPIARQAVIESMDDEVFVLDSSNRIVDINPAAQALMKDDPGIIGLPAAEVFQHYPDLVARFQHPQETREVLTMRCRESDIVYEVHISPLYDRRVNYSGRLIMLHDITEREQARLILQKAHQVLEERVQERTIELEAANQRLQVEVAERRLAEEALLYQTMHDVLTGLPNRRMFLDRLELAFERTRRHPGTRFAVLFLDLDQFKEVNDNLGHANGDRFLIAIAQRLKQSLRAVDTLARFGGDEFAILVDEIKDIQEPLLVAQRILVAFSAPVQVDGHQVVTSASIGIALAAETYRHPEEILRDADVAMYRAKAEGRGRYKVFHAHMRASM